MKISNREKRDWSLLIFIVPIGIFLMLIAGQIAVRIVPNWSVNAGMQSNLDLETVSKQQNNLIQPILPEILTPLGWFDTFLTPNSNSGDNVVYPPFIVFEPTATPSPTTSPAASPTVTETPTAPVSPSPTTVTPVPSATRTKKPDEVNEEPSVPPVTPTATGTPSVPDPSLIYVASTPAGMVVGPPDGTIGTFNWGTYVVVNLGILRVEVKATPDAYYDLVYYESEFSATTIELDHIILGISTVSDGSYYEIFNWGNGTPDNNTNVGDVAGAETDNQSISQTELYPAPPAPNPNTGILIDVDRAAGILPPGFYDHLVIISPNTGSISDGAQVDAIEITEVPIP